MSLFHLNIICCEHKQTGHNKDGFWTQDDPLYCKKSMYLSHKDRIGKQRHGWFHSQLLISYNANKLTQTASLMQLCHLVGRQQHCICAVCNTEKHKIKWDRLNTNFVHVKSIFLKYKFYASDMPRWFFRLN